MSQKAKPSCPWKISLFGDPTEKQNTFLKAQIMFASLCRNFKAKRVY